ncbi:MAG: hypothetical protein GWM90_04650 [Gemmatimonadetes bacterium]|nr:hypothetical protein [Gemmatimonadota bacterium]NIR35447.1 hypothetical protein [Actinomycetota bacterium]NIU73126.1 hypothetical protein [Gammaproteobacteria bacterium]NIQ52982.1 hypothetical protein [Gemmatimonadota bacterium]NIX43431.1 hypothetical protein [Gemmatimonadota bacterium]
MRYAPGLLIVLTVTACAAAAPGDRAPDRRHLISRAEIEESGARSAWELVESLRPQWLWKRGLQNLSEATGNETLVVYMDNARLGPPETLRRITLGSVRYLEYFDARRATHRWGSGHLQGAILVSTQDP